ncbi:MAG: hypothetical protein C0406_07270 [Sideroxydans sp.]|nr:hypothetical protein [Sideroxydans sp.]
MKNQQVLSLAIGSLLALGLVGNAVAADTKMEKCYGVAKAGANDCGSKKAGHACAGHATMNNDKNDFVALPKGTCDKLAGGSTTEASDMPKKGM